MGICTWMPAPSPVFPSASTAPRCQIALSASIPASTTLRLGLPLTDTTRPTPQDECSSSSLYMPFSASQLRLASSSSFQLRSIFVIFQTLPSSGGSGPPPCLLSDPRVGRGYVRARTRAAYLFRRDRLRSIQMIKDRLSRIAAVADGPNHQ